MEFEFRLFRDIALAVYPYDDMGVYAPEEALRVFYCYFLCYERFQGRAHPPIKAEQIVSVIHAMPETEAEYDQPLYLYPEDYPAMIERHFQTRYRRCDYNINHFFSGKIRAMRYYETCC